MCGRIVTTALVPLWHNSVAFTLTRYGGLFENGSETAVDRQDLLRRGSSTVSGNLLRGGSSTVSGNLLHLDTRKLR